MDAYLVKPRYRLGHKVATRAALPSFMVLPVRAFADELFPRHQMDGITRAIIDALSRVPDVLVIGASTALQYRSPAEQPQALHAELGVQYVLSAQVVRNDQMLTFAVRLYDARSGGLIWSDKFETHIGSFMEFEKYVVSRVISCVFPSMLASEVERAFVKPASSLTAYDFTMRALSSMEALNREAFDTADKLLLKARAYDPGYAAAYAWAARIESMRVGQGWTNDCNATALNALALAGKAIEIDPENSTALATAGHLLSYLMQDYAKGQHLSKRALEVCPNSAMAWSLASPTLTYLGQAKAGEEHAEHAIWLSPMDPYIFQFYAFAGLSCYAQGNYDAATSWFIRSRYENPNYTATLKYLIASLVGVGEVDRARALRAEMLSLEPDFAVNGHIKCAFKDEVKRNLFRTQLHTAGF